MPGSATKHRLLVCLAFLLWFLCCPQPSFIEALCLWLSVIYFILTVMFSAPGSCVIAVVAEWSTMKACSSLHLLLTFCFVWEKFPRKAQEPHMLCSFKCCLKTSDLKRLRLAQVDTIPSCCLFCYFCLSKIPVWVGGSTYFHCCLKEQKYSLRQRLASLFVTFTGTTLPCCKARILSNWKITERIWYVKTENIMYMIWLSSQELT